ncbi:hypothetical protein OUZ56_002883 [Daphnia magna]|uniref:Uncharacterized protein n=1 Tax=Daphnia magna TaxID=35525 RepID=A0ABR0A734_9CRUS|nr:hypothetical protein OUZ56_002883 [Daphnia magna]
MMIERGRDKELEEIFNAGNEEKETAGLRNWENSKEKLRIVWEVYVSGEQRGLSDRKRGEKISRHRPMRVGGDGGGGVVVVVLAVVVVHQVDEQEEEEGDVGRAEERIGSEERRKRKRIILGYVVTTMCLDGLRSKVRTGGYTRDTLDTERKAQGVQDETYYNTRSRVEAEGGRLAPDLPVDTRRKEKETPPTSTGSVHFKQPLHCVALLIDA